MDYLHRAPIALNLRRSEKRWNCATFLWNPEESLNKFNVFSLFLIPVKFGSCLTFFYGIISAVYCKAAWFDTYLRDVNPSRQGKHFMFWSVWGLLFVSFLHAGSKESLGWRRILHPERTRTEAGAWWGGLPQLPLTSGCIDSCAEYVQGAVPEGGTPDSLTYVPSCVKPSRHTPKSAGTAWCVGTDKTGLAGSWELFSRRCTELCLYSRTVVEQLSAPSQPRGYICASPKLRFELCMGPSSLLACTVPRRALVCAF